MYLHDSLVLVLGRILRRSGSGAVLRSIEFDPQPRPWPLLTFNYPPHRGAGRAPLWAPARVLGFSRCGRGRWAAGGGDKPGGRHVLAQHRRNARCGLSCFSCRRSLCAASCSAPEDTEPSEGPRHRQQFVGTGRCRPSAPGCMASA
eukprot:scaffold34921_cov236-Isochrysis_galbana.AAC.3